MGDGIAGGAVQDQHRKSAASASPEPSGPLLFDDVAGFAQARGVGQNSRVSGQSR
jgi:hypothetical protein